MITKRVMTFGRSGAAAVHLEGVPGRSRAHQLLGFALAGLIVVAIGIAGQAQSAEASADLTRAKQLAIADVGGQVGIGAAGVDVAGLRDAAVAYSATESLRGALAAHREAVAAQLAAQAAAAAQLAAEAAAAQAAEAEAAQQVADEGDDWSGGSDAAASASGEATGEAPAAAAAANPYTSEFYPGLPAAPRDEDCGPCTGKEMVPVYYNGSYVWGCDA